MKGRVGIEVTDYGLFLFAGNRKVSRICPDCIPPPPKKKQKKKTSTFTLEQAARFMSLG